MSATSAAGSSSNNENGWDEDTISFLRQATRELQFNWRAISESVQYYAKQVKQLDADSLSAMDITPDRCRQEFASDYRVATVDKPFSVSTSSSAAVSDKPIVSVVDRTDMTLEELAREVDRQEEENIRRREEIFQRVLDSLGGDSGGERSKVEDPAVSAYREKKKAQELERFKKEQRTIEIAERQYFEAERQKLKDRFAVGGIDLEGENPCAQQKSPDEFVSDEALARALQTTREFASLVESDEFDRLLTEIEHDLEARAADKNEDGTTAASSELAEVLGMLDAEASRSKQRSNSSSVSANASASPGEALSLFGDISGKQISKPSAADMIFVTPSEKALASATSNRNSDTSSCGNVAPAQQRAPTTYKSVKATAEYTTPQESRVDAYGRTNQRRGAQGLSGSVAAVQEEENSDESDDDDWRSKRRALKSVATQNVPQESVAISSTDPQFWGAYGVQSSIPSVTLEPLTEQNLATKNLTFKLEKSHSSSNDEEEFSTVVNRSFAAESVVIDDEEETLLADDATLDENSYIRRSDSSFEHRFVVADANNIEVSDPEVEVSTKAEVLPRQDLPIPPVEIHPLPPSVPDTQDAKVVANTKNSASGSLLARAGDRSDRRRRDKKPLAPAPMLKASTIKTIEVSPSISIVDVSNTVEAVAESVSAVEDVVVENQVDVEEVIRVRSDTENKIIRVSALPIAPIIPPLSVSETESTLALEVDCSMLLKDSDVPFAYILEILLTAISSSDLRILGLHTMKAAAPATISSGSQKIKLLILAEIVSRRFDKDELMEKFRVPLSTVLPGDVQSGEIIRSNASFIDLISIYTSANTSLDEYLDKFNYRVINGVSIPDSVSLNDSVMQAADSFCIDNTAVVLVRDYVLVENKGEALRDLLIGSEKEGLRMCGMRTAFYSSLSSPTDFFTLGTNTSESKYNYSDRVLCIAFYASKAQSKSHGTSTCSNTTERLRAILGPEDPALARATDPLSLRALYGESSKESKKIEIISLTRNLTWTIPFAADRIERELLCWFGPRESNLNQGSTTLLHQYKPSRVKIGMSFQCPKETLHSLNSRILSELQHQALKLLLDIFGQHCKFSSLQSISRRDFESRFARQDYPLRNVKAADLSGIFSIVEFQTISGSRYVRSKCSEFNNAIMTVAKQTSWQISGSYEISEAINATGESRSASDPHGSQLEALAALKAIPEEDLKSHEDVGLADVALLFISECVFDRLSILALVIQLLPKTTYVTVIGAKPTFVRDSAELLLCLRGYQLLENLDYAVAETNRQLNYQIKANPDSAKQIFCSVAKGRKTLDIIFKEFSLANLYVDAAITDLMMYVPDMEGLVWEETDQQRAAKMAKLLFPSGHFLVTGAVFIPWGPGGDTTRNLGKIFNRLEKDNFEILEVKSTELSRELLGDLSAENYREYPYQFSSPRPYPCESSSILDYIVIFVRRSSALLKLKSVVGPIFSAALAEISYPKSLSSLLFSYNTISKRGTSTATDGSRYALEESPNTPLIYCTLTCAMVNKVKTKIFPYFIDKKVELEHPISLNFVSDAFGDRAVSKSKNGSNSSSSYRSIAQELSTRADLSDEMRLVVRDDIDPIKGKMMDIAGIVVSHALLQEIGIGTIIETLHREGLMIVNCYSSSIDRSVAKKLLELAGASSLSMKPPLDLLLDGPALFLGIEGSSHSFVRFKSYTVDYHDNVTELWKPLAGDQTIANCNPLRGEYGVVASSSSRLGKDLYKFCFDVVRSTDAVHQLK